MTLKQLAHAACAHINEFGHAMARDLPPGTKAVPLVLANGVAMVLLVDLVEPPNGALALPLALIAAVLPSEQKAAAARLVELRRALSAGGVQQ